MTKWILVLSIAAVLTRNGMGDILVQPGYRQAQHHSIITQPPETLRHLNNEQVHQHPKSADSGYHLELHPVYTDSYHIPTNALYPLLQHYQVVPQLTQPYYNHLNSDQAGNLGLVGMPVPSDYAPLTVHSRYRRSVEPSVGEQRKKRDELDAVATKSSLDKDASSVIDLQGLDGEAAENLDEKNVKVRQSDSNQQPTTSNSLLGLNPSNMYPMYQDYRIVDQSANSNQEISNSQMLPETNGGATVIMSQQLQYPEVSTMPIESPQTNLENLQHAMLLQHPQPQQQQEQTEGSQSFEKRNFPDPRPGSATHQSPEADASNDHDKSRKATIVTNNFGPRKEMINLSETNVLHGLLLQKLHEHRFGGTQKQLMVATNHHNHAITGGLRHASAGNQPSIVTTHKGKEGTSDNLARNSAQQVVQVYQLPNGQSITCAPPTQYTMLPQNYGNSYAGNYEFPASSSYRICIHNTEGVPFVSYQAL